MPLNGAWSCNEEKGSYYQYECFVIETKSVNIASPDNSQSYVATFFVATAIWYKNLGET